MRCWRKRRRRKAIVAVEGLERYYSREIEIGVGGYSLGAAEERQEYTGAQRSVKLVETWTSGVVHAPIAVKDIWVDSAQQYSNGEPARKGSGFGQHVGGNSA